MIGLSLALLFATYVTELEVLTGEKVLSAYRNLELLSIISLGGLSILAALMISIVHSEFRRIKNNKDEYEDHHGFRDTKLYVDIYSILKTTTNTVKALLLALILSDLVLMFKSSIDNFFNTWMLFIVSTLTVISIFRLNRCV